jgi:hypothetical protein
MQTISNKEKEISIHCNFVNLVLIMKNSINERTPESSYISISVYGIALLVAARRFLEKKAEKLRNV